MQLLFDNVILQGVKGALQASVAMGGGLTGGIGGGLTGGMGGGLTGAMGGGLAGAMADMTPQQSQAAASQTEEFTETMTTEQFKV